MKKIILFSAVLAAVMGCDRIANHPAAPVQKPVAKPTEIYKVKTQAVQTFIQTTGTVQPDLEGAVKIVSPLPGYVESVNVKVGDKVKKGDLLLSIKSPDISDAYSAYLSALTQLRQAERVYNLNKRLFEVGAVAQNDLLTSQANQEQVKVLVEGYQKKLELYGVSAEETAAFPSRFPVKAPVDGAIVEIQSHIGDRLDTSSPILTIADLSKIFVVANIYDTDIQKIKKNKEVSFSTDVFPSAEFKGVVAYVSDMEDTDTKTVKTYIKLRKGSELLKLNMFLDVKIRGEEKTFPIIPKTAMIYKDGKFYVYKKAEDGFRPQEVKPAGEVGEKSVLVQGLDPDEEIALSAIERDQV
ncbi:MAG: efflux RND transporter periplasmic adaptor subunit [Nitrospinae bacterium]|nr:efflux RND transporter periplasmic adaptor subunit [Nitrospinota bacterium]